MVFLNSLKMKLSKHFKINIVIFILILIYFISMNFLKATPKGTTQFNILFWIQLIAFELICLFMIYDLKFTNKKAKLLRIITLLIFTFFYIILSFQNIYNISNSTDMNVFETYENNLSLDDESKLL